MTVWHWLVHATGSDYGAPYGRWVPYSFWSGIAGSFLVGIVVWVIAWLHKRHGAELARIREIAEKARRISADTHKALTGIEHADAPPSPPATEEP